MKRYYPLRIPKESKFGYRYIPVFIRRFFQGLYNTIRWFPVMFTNHHWHNHYMLTLLQRKLEFMRENLVTNNRYYGVEKANKDITLALNLIERIIEEYYMFEMYEYLKVSHWLKPVDATGDYLTLEATIHEDRLASFLFKYRRTATKLRKKFNLGYTDKDNATLAQYVCAYNHDKCERIFWKLLYYKQHTWSD
jgi:hypothetical protein